MYFRQIYDADTRSFTYVLADDIAASAVVIDPLASQATMILALLAERRFSLQFVLRTHLHRHDRHVCGDLCARTGARFRAGPESPAAGRTRVLADGEKVVFGTEHLAVIHTPGHTPGSVCYLWRDRLFSGETLLIQGCGYCEDEAAVEQLYESVTRRLFHLPDETLVFPGRDDNGRTVSTVREERERNHAFLAPSRSAFIEACGRSRRADTGESGCLLVSHKRGLW